ncbi:aminoglycoside phosphotransferase family protein [Curtobacterium sp. PhB136]|uniref:phosphotransferase family protein n=1 Tax=Curtobacterium sp. PhB136 TaxID=2485181 RepID=UPI0010E1A9CD|nr:aminoglycoside phosphotransferase family protein [Curtobacterium sp. PhB136]TCK64253.1 phosphotransferase family enzyme [Curtobacterium sp. PhB136]
MPHEGIDQEWLRVVVRGVGGTVDRIVPLRGGAVNHTYLVERVDADPVVLRFPVDPLRADEYPVESWAAAEAGRSGIPVAMPLAHGVERGVPFAVSEYVPPDARAIDHPWTWLGTYARAVAGIPLRDAPPSLYSRFGADVPRAWSAHLDYNIRALGDDDRLLRDGAYTEPERLRDRLGSLQDDAHDFGLAHGDLAPRNLLSRGPDQPPVLIDWGAAETGPSPWTDARRVFEWAFVDGSITLQDHAEFAAAAGLASAADHRRLATMTELHLLDVTRWALDKRPDLYDEYRDRCRTGLERIRQVVG